MGFQKLTKTDAFVVWDLADAPLSVGVARNAPKILRDGAELLARTVTYTFATFGVKAAGASAGINAKPEAKDEAVAAFVEELAPLVAEGKLVLHPANGLTAQDLAGLGGPAADPALTAASALTAAEATGGLSGRSAVVVGPGPVAEAVKAGLAERGATVVDGGVDASTDLLFLGGKVGQVDDEAAAGIQAKVLVPISSVPISTKAYAVLGRAGVTYVPDFVALAAPLLAVAADKGAEGAQGDPLERVAAMVAELGGEGADQWRAAVAKAEGFLTTWQSELPFGRPI